MRRRLLALLCAVSALLPGGCGYAGGPSGAAGEDSYTLYYVAADLYGAAGEDAVGSEVVQLAGLEQFSPADKAEGLLEALLRGPGREGLKTPFPQGTQVLSLTVANGRARVDLSFPYSTLSGVSLTLADYCLTLTLTQLEEVSSVSVTVRGQELAYRDKQSFFAEDVLLSSMEDVVSTVPVTLWFLDGEGNLTGVERRLDLYEGDTQISALIDAMEAGPNVRGMTSALPEEMRILSAQLSEGACYVNLSAAQLSLLPEGADLQTALDALALSLTSLETVEQVRYLVNGEPARFYGAAAVGQTYPRG